MCFAPDRKLSPALSESELHWYYYVSLQPYEKEVESFGRRRRVKTSVDVYNI
jgi:hypothetical protein